MLVAVLAMIAFLGAVSNTLASDRLSGHVRQRTTGDTLVIDYDLTVRRLACDSVAFALLGETVGDSLSMRERSVWTKLVPVTADSAAPDYGRRWQGQLQLPWYSADSPNHYRLRFYQKTEEEPGDSGFIVEDYCFQKFGAVGRQASLGLAWFTKSGFPKPVHSSAYGVMGRLEDKLGYRGRRFSMYAGYGLNYSRRFWLFDIPRLQIETAPRFRDAWQPIFHVAASYTRLKGREGDSEIKKSGFGAEAGVRLGGPFEALSYSYSTAVGGYHRADVIFAIESQAGGAEKIGTIFSLYRGKYVRMVAVTVYMEGWGSRGPSNETLRYRNNRPWWHKGLALSGFLPFLPMALAMLGSS